MTRCQVALLMHSCCEVVTLLARPCSARRSHTAGPEGGVRSRRRAEVTPYPPQDACLLMGESALRAGEPLVARRFYQEQRAHDASTRALEAAGERAERRQAAGMQARERAAAAVEEVLSLKAATCLSTISGC